MRNSYNVTFETVYLIVYRKKELFWRDARTLQIISRQETSPTTELCIHLLDPKFYIHL
jgi:hypothetical protein